MNWRFNIIQKKKKKIQIEQLEIFNLVSKVALQLKLKL